MPSPSRAGVTAVELSVGLVLAAGVTGVFAPVVLKLRATAARAGCAENLRRMGAAIHQHADAHAGLLPQNNPDESPAARGSHVTRVLPYLGYEQAVRGYRWDLDWAHPANAATVQTRLPVLHCPSAPDPDRWIAGTRSENVGGAQFKAAPSDYVAIPTLTGALVPAVFPEDFDRVSVMPSAAPRRRDDVPDGAANTLLVVEIADKPNHWRGGKRVQVPDTNEDGYGVWASPGNVNSMRGYSWDGTGFPGPCPMNCSNLYAVYAFHPGGSNILFADGTVRFVRQSIDIWVFYAIVTSRGGERLAPGDF